MTRWQVTYANTWRDNLVIWSQIPIVTALVGLAFLLLFVEPLWPRRRA